MKKLILNILFFVVTCLALTTSASAQQAGKQVPVKIPITNSAANAYLYLPWDYNSSGKSYPLIIFCHGLGEAGNKGGLSIMLNQGLPGVINKGEVPYSSTKPGDTTRFIVLS